MNLGFLCHLPPEIPILLYQLSYLYSLTVWVVYKYATVLVLLCYDRKGDPWIDSYTVLCSIP